MRPQFATHLVAMASIGIVGASIASQAHAWAFGTHRRCANVVTHESRMEPLLDYFGLSATYVDASAMNEQLSEGKDRFEMFRAWETYALLQVLVAEEPPTSESPSRPQPSNNTAKLIHVACDAGVPINHYPAGKIWNVEKRDNDTENHFEIHSAQHDARWGMPDPAEARAEIKTFFTREELKNGLTYEMFYNRFMENAIDAVKAVQPEFKRYFDSCTKNWRKTHDNVSFWCKDIEHLYQPSIRNAIAMASEATYAYLYLSKNQQMPPLPTDRAFLDCDMRTEEANTGLAVLDNGQRVKCQLGLKPPAARSCEGSPEGWQGCRGNGCSACVDALNEYPSYFEHHPLCTPNNTCAGRYYRCSPACPAPTDADRAPLAR